MNDNENKDLEQLETLVKQKIQSFPYPPTPDLAAQARARQSRPARRPTHRLAWAVAVLLLIGGLLLAVPQTRATLLDIIRAGAVTLIIDDGPSTSPQLSTLEETLFANSQPLSPAEAQAALPFPLLAPPDLGSPDAVYLPQIAGLNGQVALMVWREDGAPEGVRLLIYQIGAPFFGIKEAAASSVRSTRISGSEAFWIEDQHTLTLGRDQNPNLVTRDVLVWNQDEVTFRLESNLTFTQVQQLAESLQPLSE